MSAELYFSVLVHEKPEVIRNQILNFRRFAPGAVVVLHLAKAFAISEEDLASLASEPNVWITSERLATRKCDLVWPHLANIREIVARGAGDGARVAFHASNDLLIREGVEAYTSRFAAGYFADGALNAQTEPEAHAAVLLDEVFVRLIEELSLEQDLIWSQIEGAFFQVGLLRRVLARIEAAGFDPEAERGYISEEVLLPTLAHAELKGSGAPIGVPYVLSEISFFAKYVEWREQLFGESYPGRVFGRLLKLYGPNRITPALVGRIRSGNPGFYSAFERTFGRRRFDFANVFGVKRVDRLLEDPLRRFITSLPTPGEKMRVVISNGSNQFHLAPLASEIAGKGFLAGFLTSGWPTRFTKLLAWPFRSKPAVQRFFNRRESVPEELVHPFNLAEVLFQLGSIHRRLAKGRGHFFDLLGFNWYAARAAGVLRRLRPTIYHFRACYGLSSLPVAREVGAVTICDHSLAHPGVLQHMVQNEGRWPERAVHNLSPQDFHPLQPLMERDLRACDHVLVNSDFVRETCVFSGMSPDRVHVVYLGVDDKFFDAIPDFDAGQVRARAGRPMLFAGGVHRRKGIEILARALQGLDEDWRLKLVGGYEYGIEGLPGVADWLAGGRVESVGFVARQKLPMILLDAPIFVFPSFCEGSARVIFEAMASGCFVITTPNSGSIVRDGENGILVPSGDADALAAAIRWALSHPDEVAEMGWKNSVLVKRDFRQSRYGDRVQAVYEKILAS